MQLPELSSNVFKFNTGNHTYWDHQIPSKTDVKQITLIVQWTHCNLLNIIKPSHPTQISNLTTKDIDMRSQQFPVKVSQLRQSSSRQGS